MIERLTIGYRQVRTRHDSWLWTAGDTQRGHEFHYSRWHPPAGSSAYAIDEARPERVHIGNLIVSYIHLHFWAARDSPADSWMLLKNPCPEARSSRAMTRGLGSGM